MTYPLTAFKLFIDTQARLDAITPGDMATLTPGKPIPEEAIVIGMMSPTMKALACVCEKLAAEGLQMKAEVMTRLGSDANFNRDSELEPLREFTSKARCYALMFRAALLAEYPGHMGVIGYSPNFEVYELPTRRPDPSDLFAGGEAVVIGVIRRGG